MTDLRTAAQQALEFIRWSQFVPCQSEPFPKPPLTAPQVEAALRAALAEPVQEPDPGEYHGWVLREVLFDNGEPVGHREPVQEPVAWKDKTYESLHHQDFGNSIPLYTAPPQRKPLTDDEIKKLLIEHAGMTVAFSEVDLRFARAIERAHGVGGDE